MHESEFSATHAKRVIGSGVVLERKASITGVVPELKNKVVFLLFSSFFYFLVEPRSVGRHAGRERERGLHTQRGQRCTTTERARDRETEINERLNGSSYVLVLVVLSFRVPVILFLFFVFFFFSSFRGLHSCSCSMFLLFSFSSYSCSVRCVFFFVFFFFYLFVSSGSCCSHSLLLLSFVLVVLIIFLFVFLLMFLFLFLFSLFLFLSLFYLSQNEHQSQFSVEDATATISSGAISERTRKLKEEQEALRQKHATERQDTDLPLISAEMSRQVRPCSVFCVLCFVSCVFDFLIDVDRANRLTNAKTSAAVCVRCVCVSF